MKKSHMIYHQQSQIDAQALAMEKDMILQTEVKIHSSLFTLGD